MILLYTGILLLPQVGPERGCLPFWAEKVLLTYRQTAPNALLDVLIDLLSNYMLIEL